MALPASPILDPHAARRAMENAERVQRLLDVAYSRPCFVCGVRGDCNHREPEVEYAIFGLGELMAGLKTQKPPSLFKLDSKGKVVWKPRKAEG